MVDAGAKNVFVAGDAAGLSNQDMGERIHAAIQSGIATADTITAGRPLRLKHISRFSLPKLLTSGMKQT